VEARRQDAWIWRRHWIEGDRLVVEFVDLTLVEVDQSSGSVVFDRELPPEMEQHLLLDHVLPLVLASRGAVVLHGAVISRSGAGAVLIGATGAGKSTLTAFAWQRGWTVGGDDGAVVLDTVPPTVEATYSTVRLTPTSADLLAIDRTATSPVVGKMRIEDADGSFSGAPVELRLIATITPAPSGEAASLRTLDGVDAHVDLFRSTFHAALTGGGLLEGAVDRLGAIVDRTTVARLTVPRGVEGLVAAERLLRASVDGVGATQVRLAWP
jgi:hypothetical protein